ncbi:MAG: hypothetical protein GY856_09580 [bacterium]|nr:hypothetical protein [bacterium]
MLPAFNEAEGRLRNLLERAGRPIEIVWVFREDLSVKRNGRLWVSVPLPDDNREMVGRLYEKARQDGLPVELAVFCLLDSKACTFVYVPDNKLDAEHRMISGLKVSVPTRPRKARALGGSWIENIKYHMAGRERKDPWLGDVPSKALENAK